jgi:beta-lactamase class A
MTWEDLDAHLDKVPGTVSAYVGRLGAPPTWTRQADATHYAASTMKAAVLVALYRAAEAGRLDLDAPVPVRNSFDSAAPGAPRFANDRNYDNDDAVWARVDGTATLRWLAERMIVRSSNLATNIVIGHVGLPAVAEAWALGGARHSVTGRGIEDYAAREADIDNLVTAADLAALLGELAPGCASMLDVLFAQEHREDLAAGLPEGTRIAHKNGWIRGVRHGAGVVYPADAPPYTIVVCTTTELADGGPSGEETEDDACRLIANVSAQVWQARHELTG